MTNLSTLGEVREVFEREPARVGDPQLLALLLARGAARKARGARPRKRFTAAARLLQVKQRLEKAQHKAAARPVAACLEP